MHFRNLDGLSGSIALFRRLNSLPDLKWPEQIYFYPWSLIEEGSQPPAHDRLRWAAESALSGDVSVFEAYRPREIPTFYSTSEPLPAIALDLATSAARPLDWWLGATPDEGWSANQKAVHELAKHMELVDWLQTAVTASSAPWVFEWSFVPTSDQAYEEWRNVLKHAVDRWKAGDGLEWAAVALELLPPRQPGVPAPRDERGVPVFDYALANEVLALHKALVRKVEACTATPLELAAAVALAAPAHAHGAPPALLRPLLPRSPEAVVQITKKGLRRAFIEGRDVRPWLDIATAIEATVDPSGVLLEDVGRIARYVRFLTAKSFDDAVAIYDGRPLDAEAESVLNLLPYKALARLGARTSWTIQNRGLVVRAALARAWALGHTEAALGMLRVVADTNRELAAEVARVQKQSGRQARVRALLLLILRTPAINMELASATSGIDLITFWGADGEPRRSVFAIDHMRHSLLNRWCPLGPRTVKRERVLHDVDTLLRLPTGSSYRDIRGYVDWEVGRHETSKFRSSIPYELSAVLSAKRTELIERHPVVRRADDHELRALSRVRSAPEALSRAAITWARSVRRDQSTTGADPDVAEALHLAVGTTRWSCQMAGGQGPWSREAFALLHDRWGTTTWAARTPYWFDAVSGGLTPLPSRSR